MRSCAQVPGHWDLLILGAGPAAGSAAIFAARAGLSVCVLSPPDSSQRGNQKRVGESLSVAASGVLRELGLWDTFVADAHPPCHAQAHAWGSDQLQYYDGLQDLRARNGVLAWHLDRKKLLERMAQSRHELGVCEMRGWLRRAHRQGGAWSCELVQQEEPSCKATAVAMTTSWVFDATGRASRFARRHGAQRWQLDKQLALVGYHQFSAEDAVFSGSLVETLPQGWCYSAPAVGGGAGMAVSALFCQPGGEWKSEGQSRESWWQQAMDGARYTSRRLSGPSHLVSLQAYSAGTARLDRFHGDGWLAIGDAAMSFDPLSAHGVTVAMLSGRDAVRALTQPGPVQSSLEEWAARLDQAFTGYWQPLEGYYLAETRWPDAPYWQARRASFARAVQSAV